MAAMNRAFLTTGLPPRVLQEVTGIFKAYCTRVGNGPFPSELMIGGEAEALTDAIDTDDDELEEARWIPRDRARALIDGVDPDGLFVPPPSAIAHHLIRGWARGES